MSGDGKMEQREVERLLRGGALSNPEHKEALRKRLFDGTAELSLDDLASVTGGVSANTLKLEDWPDGTRQRPPMSAGDSYVEATCGACGATGKHLMTSGWTARCWKCGEPINLKAQG